MRQLRGARTVALHREGRTTGVLMGKWAIHLDHVSSCFLGLPGAPVGLGVRESSRERDVDPGAAEVDEGDQRPRRAEAERSMADEADAAVEAFEAALGLIRQLRVIPRI